LPARAIFVLYLSPTRYGDQSGDQNTRSRGSDFTLDNHSHPEDFEPTFRCRDWDYIKTFGLSLVAGRYPYSSNTLKEVVLNENSVRQLGFRSTEQIVGHLFRWGDLHSPGCVIVGVVHDFIDGSLKEKIGPLMLVTMANQYQLLAVKVDPLRSKDITWHWREFSGGYIRRIFIMPNGSTRGLRVSMTRKPPRPSCSVSFLIGLAFLIATLIGIWVMSQWLLSFSYHVRIGWWIPLCAILLSLVIAWVTIGLKAFRAALANPVSSLRSE